MVINNWQWRNALALADAFWRRWLKEVTPTMAKRTKWLEKSKALKEGDFVVMADENLPRNCWTEGLY